MALAVAPSAGSSGLSPAAEVDVLCEELAELCGQQNVIAGKITGILARVEDVLGVTGARSLEHFATWQLGVSPARARNLAAIARRRDALPVTVGLLGEGVVSEDQAAVIARRAPDGTDEHYADLARFATVSQLQTALRLAPTPPPADPQVDPVPPPDPGETRQASASWTELDEWVLHARLPKLDGAVVDTALRAHLDALVTEWKRDRDDTAGGGPVRSFPTLADALVRMATLSLDAEAALRPHGHRTTLVLHVDVDRALSELHLGPALTDAERQELGCDARVQTWFERAGVPIGAARDTREIPRRLRRALEHRSRGRCEVPGCDARAGLHAHHLVHWEHGGPTDLANLVLVCPHHHRAHHRGSITIRGPAHHLEVLDQRGRPLTAGSLARPPTRAPDPAHYDHPLGERADWRWYHPPELN
jgi:hypothetical protein